ncbi:glycosyltransferase family 2 protein [Hydrogenophaga sp. A37]
MPPPRISVVVPTCRRPALLGRCLCALLDQSIGVHAFEILVVDDGHCDRTRDCVEALASHHLRGFLRYLRPTEGRGPAVARNCGWRAARAPLIAFTDDDTVPSRVWLEVGEHAMLRHGWTAMGGRVVVPRTTDAPSDHEQMTRGLEKAEFVTANAFVLRAALQQVGGFDERFERAWREDTDLQFRLEEVAGVVGHCDHALVAHPVRPERWGVSLRQQKNVFFDALLFRKHPRRYRARVRTLPPIDFYAVVVLTLAALLSAWAGAEVAAWVCALAALALLLRFTVRRLRSTSHRPAHVLEMLATSALIPFLSVYWRLRGAWHFRVWFF